MKKEVEELKKLTASCRFCGKEVYSLYRGQLDYNVKAHEISCPERIKGEPDSVKNQSEASNDCPYCGLSMDEHEGLDGCCPGGTEEFGGRR